MRLFHYRLEHRREIAGRGIDDLQHLCGRGLLLQGLACLVNEPRVLHRDNCLCGEVLRQRDLLVSERADLLAVDRKGAEQVVALAQRHRQVGACAADINQKAAPQIARTIGLILARIGNVHHRLAAQEAFDRRPRIDARWANLPCPFIEARMAAGSCELNEFAVIGPKHPKSRFTQPHRLFEHRIEHRREITGRRIDDLQHLGGRGLSRQRFVALGRYRVELPPQLGYGLPEIDLRVVWHRLRLPSTITRDDTLPAPAPPAMSAKKLGKSPQLADAPLCGRAYSDCDRHKIAYFVLHNCL